MRFFLLLVFSVWVIAGAGYAEETVHALDGKHLGVVFNNDINNILWMSSGKDTSVEEYRFAVNRILDLAPGVFAQNVGMPDPVIYRSHVATTWDKYHAQVTKAVWPETKPEDAERQAAAMRRLLELGTDPFTITIQACRERGVPIVASYRMNAEDFYGGELDLSDFDREHKDLRIPGRDCLDPVHPDVYEHRMKIFTEVASDYDIDGIELDFRRWYYMISEPLKNFPVLTRMVADTRKMLDETAQRKGKKKMLLGVRVGPMLEGAFNKEDFPGSYYPEPTNQSCRNLGLDVKTWVEQRLVDYVCPTLFSPMGLPRTKEFVDLVKGADIGIYPTLSYTPTWAHYDGPLVPDNEENRLRHLRDICTEALKCYDDGADGVSLFNWFPHTFPPVGQDSTGWGRKREWPAGYRCDAPVFGWVQQVVMPVLSKPETLRAFMTQELPQALKITGPWKPHVVRLLNGANPVLLRAQLQIVTEAWNRVVAVPYIVYMPEKDRLLMLVGCDYPHHAMVLSSDDHGAHWTDPRPIYLDKDGKTTPGLGTSLTYLGNGKVLLATDRLWFSSDYGETWGGPEPQSEPLSVPPTADGKTWNLWDPILVEKKDDGSLRLVETGYAMNTELYEAAQGPGYSTGQLRFSTDGGRTWSSPTVPPEWKGINEVALVRAANGNLVAACRTDISAHFKGQTLDHFEGLAASVSKDDGLTWSEPNRLYDWGRHHPCMVLMRNGDIVMTYVVRKGYTEGAEGFARFGIEAIVSHDNGESWDLDHRYILHVWTGNRKGPEYWWASSQATSTVLLPDDSLLTAFGTGYRSQPGPTGLGPRDAGLIRWRLSDAPLSDEHAITAAPPDSELRNVFVPND